MTSLEALCYLDDIAHGRKMKLDAHELKLIVEKDLKALEIIKKYFEVLEDEDDFFRHYIKDKQYVSSKSCFVMSEEEYQTLKEVGLWNTRTI